MNQPWVYMCSPVWIPLPPPSPSHPSGSSQRTSPEHPASCIEPGLVIYFTYDNIHVSMLFSQIIPPLHSPTESKRLFFTSVSLLLSHIYSHHYHLYKFHIYALVYCIGVFLSGLLHKLLSTYNYTKYWLYSPYCAMHPWACLIPTSCNSHFATSMSFPSPLHC